MFSNKVQAVRARHEQAVEALDAQAVRSDLTGLSM